MWRVIFRSLLLWGTIHCFTFYFSFEKRIGKKPETPCIKRLSRSPSFERFFSQSLWRQHQGSQWEKRHVTVTNGHLIVFKERVKTYKQNNDISLINLYPDTFFHVSHSHKQFNFYFKKIEFTWFLSANFGDIRGTSAVASGQLIQTYERISPKCSSYPFFPSSYL